jgi:hypothetical protein
MPLASSFMRLKGLGNLVTAAQLDLLMVEMGAAPINQMMKGKSWKVNSEKHNRLQQASGTSTRLFLFLTPVIELSES